MQGSLCHLVYLLCIPGAAGDTQKTSSPELISILDAGTHVNPSQPTNQAILTGVAAINTKSGIATCRSRTINWITHGLPQQCLKTDRISLLSTITASVHSTVDVTSLTTPASTLIVNVHESDTATSVADLVATAVTSTISVVTSAYSTPLTDLTASGLEVYTDPVAVDENESPLDNANFLSFEEWKKQNLAKLGQSAEDLGRGQPVPPSRPRPGINNALDSIGEENEIELDFSGFGGAAASAIREAQSQESMTETGPSESAQSGSPKARSKDAGKTCKERTNYASFDCSATILKTNKECKSSSSILVENKDSYALNTCSAKNKFIIVQLCNDIMIDTVVLANYEFFSASFRHFRLSVSDRYPVEMEKWKDLGTFEARNTREIQAFLIEDPQLWARYLRVEFLTHYGTEYYCPVTLLRVHGITMIEDYRRDEDLARGEQAQIALQAEIIASTAVAAKPSQSTDETVQATPEFVDVKHYESASVVQTIEEASMESHVSAIQESSETSVSAMNSEHNTSGILNQVGVHESSNMHMTCKSSSPTDTNATSVTPRTNHEVVPSAASAPSVSSPRLSEPMTQSSDLDNLLSASSVAAKSAETHQPASRSAKPSLASLQESSTQPIEHDTISSESTATNSIDNSTTQVAGLKPLFSTNATRSIVATSTNSPPPQPSTQESFFKSFHKRLLQLESNSTLSLKYIEEQSRILRDAFNKVEKRQLSSTTRFLSQLNETVMLELHSLKQAYDQLWQGTVIELEGQQETYQREMLALSSRLTMMADELVWQKRLGIFQSTLMLLCLAMALFGRSEGRLSDLPLMQYMLNKSTSSFRNAWESPPNSPSPDSRSPASIFRKRMWRSKTEPGGDVVHLTEPEHSRPRSQQDSNGLTGPASPTHGPLSSDVDELDDADSSLSAVRKNDADEGSASPRRHRKRLKKPPGWPHGSGPNGRAKSPLAM